MNNKCDVLLVNPGDKKNIYQDLSKDFSAIELPVWIYMHASYLVRHGLKVDVLDSNALNLTPEESAEHVKRINPILTLIVVNGSQPSASTQLMPIAKKMCTIFKSSGVANLAMTGLHPSALPEHTLEEADIDYLIYGEGFESVLKLTESILNSEYKAGDVAGVWSMAGAEIIKTERPQLLENLDLLSTPEIYKYFPMEKYKAHNWHCFEDITNRYGYGSIYTSLGCPFKCEFCCINAPYGKPAIRYRSVESILDEIEFLTKEYNIKHLKIADELFILKDEHYMGVVDGLIERNININIWAYARIDTIKPSYLPKMKRAGINWLAIGIESASVEIRGDKAKRFTNSKVFDTVKQIKDSGINIIGNYIFGLPNDTIDSMKDTLEMAKELNCEFANFYSAMAYPGSALFSDSVERGDDVSFDWSTYSQHSYNTKPIGNKLLSPEDVVSFRDVAFNDYFSDNRYLNMIRDKFCDKISDHIIDMLSIRLERQK